MNSFLAPLFLCVSKAFVINSYTKAIVKLSEAVSRVFNKRHDFQATIMTAHRDLVTRKGDEDPFVSQGKLHANLVMERDTPEFIDARVELVRALLHVWYRVQPDLKAMVMNAVREIAVLNREEPMNAVMEAQMVLDGARGAGEAISEGHAKMRKAGAERERKREAKLKQNMLGRLNREDVRNQLT